MLSVQRTVTTATPAERVYAYLADFSNAAQWDSGTQSCERISGDGGVGTVYRNVSKFLGRKVRLDYRVERNTRPTFVVTGHTGRTTTRDTITVTTVEDRTVVDYLAEFELGGMSRLIKPVMSSELDRLADDTAATLHEALERL